jgi:hypothetical protein
LKFVIDLVYNLLQRCYLAEVSSCQSIKQEAVGNLFFDAMVQPQRGVDGNGDEVDQYLSIDIVQSAGFIDILLWWSARQRTEGIAVRPLLNGHGLPRNTGDVDAIRTGQ